MSWLRNIRQWTVVNKAGEFFRLEEDKESLFAVIANVRKTGQGHKKEEWRYKIKHKYLYDLHFKANIDHKTVPECSL